MRILICFIFILAGNYLFAQTISGTVINEKSKQPVAYVNIGIAGKNIGTVSDFDGQFKLDIAPEFDNEPLLFSCIGYMPYTVNISELKRQQTLEIRMKEQVVDLKEIVIRPRIFKEKTLGIVTDSKFMNAGFKDNQLGYEMGILMEVKKSAVLKRVDLNIANCSYDTIFYRLNIYRSKGKSTFENVLKAPIYINLPKSKVTDKISIDLLPYDVVVSGDFLVSVELVKDLGPGNLYFCAGLKDKTYYRKTSQGVWDTAPVGISISVLADVEK